MINTMLSIAEDDFNECSNIYNVFLYQNCTLINVGCVKILIKIVFPSIMTINYN